MRVSCLLLLSSSLPSPPSSPSVFLVSCAGLSNTEAAAMLRDLSGTIVIVARKTTWVGSLAMGMNQSRDPFNEDNAYADGMPMTPRSASRSLV